MDMEDSIDVNARRRIEFYEPDNENELREKNGEGLVNDSQLEIVDTTIPRIGMEFDSEDAAYNFYNEYAKVVGFGIRRHSVHFDRNGKILDIIFCCRSQGHRGKDNRDAGNKFHQPLTRTGCEAKMKINSRHNGKYKVTDFIVEHGGHDLLSPGKTFMLRSHRNIDGVHASLADDLDKSGIAPKAGFALMSKQVGGRENVGFIVEDYKNYLGTKRSLEMKAGEAGGALEYLKQKQVDNPNFFYAMQLDQDDLVANIIWIDAQMMIDYAHFGDVVTFDTTYRKNKEGRPFALFVGVNHHKQTVVFGAALLYDETIPTFIWLFDTFAKAMSNKEPQVILTDQDAAMAKTLVTQWPKTCHRLCIWHIYKNAATHLSHVFGQFPSFSKDFRSCIYDYDEEDDFLHAWRCMVEKYGLETNQWLERLFKIREKWALVYGRRYFCAEMTTTQRSESMNSLLKKYVSYKHNLLQFFHHFDRMIEERRYLEFRADFKTSQGSLVALIPVQILKHAACVYTHTIFKLFQEEVHKAYDSKLELCYENGDTSEYKVSPFGKAGQHIVLFCSSNCIVSCSCRKFEFAGVLCSHVLKVFSLRNIVKIPDQYIMKRWTKNAKKNISDALMEIKFGPSQPLDENEEKKMRVLWYKKLCSMYNQLATRAAMTAQTFEIASNGLVKLIEEVDASLEKMSLGASESEMKSVMQSRVVDKQTSLVEICNKKLDEGHTYGEIKIKGWKKKEKNPIKSGRRPRSGLEKRRRKKTKNDAIIQIENIDHSQIQYIDNGTNISSSVASMGYGPLPYLSQISQEFDISRSNSTMSNLIEGSSMSHAEPDMFAKSLNPILNQSETSLTHLLQQQIFKQQDSGAHGEFHFINSSRKS